MFVSPPRPILFRTTRSLLAPAVDVDGGEGLGSGEVGGEDGRWDGLICQLRRRGVKGEGERDIGGKRMEGRERDSDNVTRKTN